jgi:multicomponent Na+:H+ antiporter subunit F
VVSLLAFVGSVSVARYIGGMLIQSAGDGQDVGLQPARELDASRDAGEAGR